MATYQRKLNTNDVYDVSGPAPRYISFDEANQGNIWNQVQDVPNIRTIGGTSPEVSNENPTRTLEDLNNAGSRGNSYQIFNSALMDMLKKYQTLGTKPSQMTQIGLQNQQADKVLATAEGGFSPSQQSSMRNAQVSAIQPSITGSENRQQTYEQQLGAFGNVLNASRDYAQSQMEAQVKHEEDTRKSIQDAIDTYGSKAFEGLDEKALAQIEKDANYPKGYLTRKSKTIKEQELAISQQNANTAAQKTTDTALDKNIGNTVKVGDKTYMWNPATQNYDTEVAPGSQDKASAAKVAALQDKLVIVDNILKDAGLNNITGSGSAATAGFQIHAILGDTQTILGKVAQLVSMETVDSLIEAKAKGATFGALSDRELEILKAAATPLGNAEVRNKDNKVIGYNMSKEGFALALDNLKKATNDVISSMQEGSSSGSGGGTSDIWDFKSLGSDSNNARKISQAIGQYESGSNYNAIGKVTASGDRAYGKYQVMGNNIPSWTKEATGKSMTVKEFLNNPEAQDKVAESRMGRLLAQYGNIGDVASVWFSGRPISKAGNAKDINGTTVPGYIKNVTNIYNKLS